ncbi:MAG: pentapeptide repeat-containing protein [Solirubrobacteraceae bacterium]
MPAKRLRVRESELRGVVLEPGNVPGLTLADVILRDCGMSNVDAREGRLSRVEVHRSQLVGFGFSRGDLRDLRVIDSSLQLASFASATLRNVVFERVNLAEASFMHARLEAVAFVDCRLEGADFRHAKLAGCAIRGTSLDGVLGVESMRGLRMPWPDVMASAGALAVALGIDIESD